jgi:hypothetical protein
MLAENKADELLQFKVSEFTKASKNISPWLYISEPRANFRERVFPGDQRLLNLTYRGTAYISY